MTTQYAEEQGFKKKYLAPLIVLMLCAVSLTGAAYAYSTSVTGHGDISGDYISIDMYSDKDATAELKGDLTSKHFQVYTERTVASTVTYNAYVEAGQLVYSTYVKVSTDIPSAKLTLAATGAYKAATLESGTVGKLIIKDVTTDGGDATITDLTKFMTVTKVSDNSDAKDDKGVITLEGGEVYKVDITFDIGQASANAFGTFNSVEDLQKAVNAFDADGVGFTFALKANYIEPTE